MTMLIAGGIVVLLIVAFARTRKPVTEYVYYDPDEGFPPRPQPWGIDDYRPWPGTMELYDHPEEEIEAVTVLWNEAMNAGDTVLADCLFEEYERLYRAVQ